MANTPPKKYPIVLNHDLFFCIPEVCCTSKVFQKDMFLPFCTLDIMKDQWTFFGIPEWQFVKLSWGRILCCWQWRAVQGWAQTGPSLERCIFHMSRSKEYEGNLPPCQSPCKIQVQYMLIITGILIFYFSCVRPVDQVVTKKHWIIIIQQLWNKTTCLLLPTVTFKVMGRERASDIKSCPELHSTKIGQTWQPKIIYHIYGIPRLAVTKPLVAAF